MAGAIPGGELARIYSRWVDSTIPAILSIAVGLVTGLAFATIARIRRVQIGGLEFERHTAEGHASQDRIEAVEQYNRQLRDLLAEINARGGLAPIHYDIDHDYGPELVVIPEPTPTPIDIPEPPPPLPPAAPVEQSWWKPHLGVLVAAIIGIAGTAAIAWINRPQPDCVAYAERLVDIRTAYPNSDPDVLFGEGGFQFGASERVCGNPVTVFNALTD